MLPIIKLSQAWLEELGWSSTEAAGVLDMALASAGPAGPGDVCPQCARPNTEYRGWVFVPDPSTATSEHEHGRAYVSCVCGAMYWYAAVDVVDEPNCDARVRATSVTRTPGTGAIQIDGQPVPPLVVEEIAVTDEVAVVIAPEPGTAEQQLLIPTPPPEPPPGQQMLVVPRWSKEQRRWATFAAAVALGLGTPRTLLGE